MLIYEIYCYQKVQLLINIHNCLPILMDIIITTFSSIQIDYKKVVFTIFK